MNSFSGTSMMLGVDEVAASPNLPKSNASKKHVLRLFGSPLSASSLSKRIDRATCLLVAY